GRGRRDERFLAALGAFALFSSPFRLDFEGLAAAGTREGDEGRGRGGLGLLALGGSGGRPRDRTAALAHGQPDHQGYGGRQADQFGRRQQALPGGPSRGRRGPARGGAGGTVGIRIWLAERIRRSRMRRSTAYGAPPVNAASRSVIRSSGPRS